ncbi:MAG: hypothetical protein BWY03_00307 [Parcubacteria group bacterium ADurb.Bin159]|jgi:hypothetical protein|nr:MAG: hypothetical protein BWY03_00307 [Parcubacteria group bacterium ADurb.Bin159]
MPTSVQKYLPVSEIKRDCLILNDGSLRAVLLTSSINFALKSEEEQEAIVDGYVQFLNAIDFPLQIVIQSRPFNIDPYVEHLKELRRDQENELLRAQMADYIDFVEELVKLGQIMSRRFYIVVPYNPLGDKKRGFFNRLIDLFSAPTKIIFREEKFEKYRQLLYQRVDHVASNLAPLGINVVPLDTQSLIELCYNTYNPEISVNEPMAEIEKLRVEA